jgi:hypothetical protein
MITNNVNTFMRGIGEEAQLVDQLVAIYTSMKSARNEWESECDEVMKYVFATDTRRTVQPIADFKNSTTIPKLAQVRNNIITSYDEHLFPNTDWVQWQAEDSHSVSEEKVSLIKAYTKTKAEDSDLEAVMNQLVVDWTDRGIACCETYHVNVVGKDSMGNPVQQYSGPRCQRLDPYDVVYDVTAPTLEAATKVVRSMHTLGSLKKMSIENPEMLSPEQFMLIKKRRQEQRSYVVDVNGKNTRLTAQLVRAGHGDTINTVLSNQFEILTFYGDFYDEEKDELYSNHRIVVLDRAIILEKKPVESLSGKHAVHIAVWETREGTLAPMGPLARIIGLQYKLDKLENLRADKFDLLANPPLVMVGDVTITGVKGTPNCVYHAEEGGDVREMVESAIALQADTQIQFTLALMDELSGNPKESIGQRTPGEKTKFEVQLLDAGQNKTFRNKVKKFEKEILSPVLQDYLEQGRRNLDGTDLIRVLDDKLGAIDFQDVTRDDIAGRGKIRARGSSVFAQKANALQNLVTIVGSPLGAVMAPHTSGIRLTKAVEELADLKGYGIYLQGIGIQEAQQLQRLTAKSQDKTDEVNLNQEDVTNDAETGELE